MTLHSTKNRLNFFNIYFMKWYDLKVGIIMLLLWFLLTLDGWVNGIVNSCVYKMIMWRVRGDDPPMIEDLLISPSNAR